MKTKPVMLMLALVFVPRAWGMTAAEHATNTASNNKEALIWQLTAYEKKESPEQPTGSNEDEKSIWQFTVYANKNDSESSQ
jgi:hypothetical protein